MASPGGATTRNGSPARLIGGLRLRPRRRAVAIGTFDGVHRGHERVIAGCDTVLTFDPHPRSVLQPGNVPRLLTDAPGKRRRLAALGVREVVVIPFDREWAALDAATFVDELIVRRLGAVAVSVGADFRFGALGGGDAGTLEADPRFVTTVARMVTIEGDVVSSSRIRDLVAAGDVERAARLLGRPHTLPAQGPRGGQLVFDPALAIPPPGRYSVTAGGVATHLSLSGDGVIELERSPATRSVEVSFLKADLSRPASC
jgi:riboflavin kinase/FMN adenylyltransferase